MFSVQKESFLLYSCVDLWQDFGLKATPSPRLISWDCLISSGRPYTPIEDYIIFYLFLVFQQMKQDGNAKYVGRTLVGGLLLYYNYPALSSEVGFCDRVTFSAALDKIIIG